MGFGVPVHYNGQTTFPAQGEEAAQEALRNGVGAYADDVTCALPEEVTQALAAMEAVPPPGAQTSSAHGRSIRSLVLARDAANEIPLLRAR